MKITIPKLIVILIFISAITAFTIFYLINHLIPFDATNTIRYEIIKSLLSILSVAIIGGIVASLFKSYERNYEQTRIRTEAKIEFMKRLGELYRSVKSIRRKLSANAIKDSNSMFVIPLTKDQITVYIEEMEVLNNIQLELEGLYTSITNYKLFNYKSEVKTYLSVMEKYLREILREYEDNSKFLKHQTHANLNNLRYLKEFTFPTAKNEILFVQSGNAKEKNYCFKNTFSKSYYKLLQNLS